MGDSPTKVEGLALGDPKAVVTPDQLSPEEQAKLAEEIKAAEMDKVWRERADRKDWDQVKADLAIYQYSGVEVTEDPRRTAEYTGRRSWTGLASAMMPRRSVQACRRTTSRRAVRWCRGSLADFG